jgi:hypothetical protein
LAALPPPFAILFVVDESLAPELVKLSYRRVRIEGKLDPTPTAVWLDKNGHSTGVTPAPPLKAGEPATLNLPRGRVTDGVPDPIGNSIDLIYVIRFNIDRFELAN